MHSQQEIEHVAAQLLSAKDFKLLSCQTLQSLWAGYGHICQIKALPTNPRDASKKQEPLSLILKYISPPKFSSTAASRPSEGHIRKILSYQIEQYFYSYLATQMPAKIAVASCLSSIDMKASTNATAMIMTDLRQSFPVAGEKRSELTEKQVYAAIDWLANFHGFWWNKANSFDRSTLCRPPLEEFEQTKSTVRNGGVWLNGGYTYLATRRDEYINLLDSNSEWSASLCSPLASLEGQSTVAELAAKFLAPSKDKSSPISDYETLIHGDVKSENLFTSTSGDAVAFFDFQYVGLGLGVCDLAKLFTCSVPELMLSVGASSNYEGEVKMGQGEQKLLRYYLDKLRQASEKEYEWDLFVRHWETALVDWLRFQASWGFWGNTEWLEGRVRSILKDEEWKAFISAE